MEHEHKRDERQRIFLHGGADKDERVFPLLVFKRKRFQLKNEFWNDRHSRNQQRDFRDCPRGVEFYGRNERRHGGKACPDDSDERGEKDLD